MESDMKMRMSRNSRKNVDEEERRRRLNNGVDELHLFSHVLEGTHDYDWLLTPPGTPLFPSSTSTCKVSISQSDNNRSTTTTSLTRHSHNNNSCTTRSSILNTSSSSVSSYLRPSSPIPRSARSHPTPASRPAPSQPSRPATPASRPARPSAPPTRSSTPTPRPSAPPTRSSTPTRRNSMPTASPSSPSPARLPLNARNSASRPTSPTPRPHTILPPDFPQHTPSNLRTTLPNRPLSASRSRPTPPTPKPNSETQPSSRRHSSPIVSRGRFPEPAAPKTRGYANSNAHHVHVPEPRKLSHAPEVGPRRSVKSSSTTTTTVPDNTPGFGRTISKKSLDVAIKHMDIRTSSGNLRALSNSTLFPQSIRRSASPNPKSQLSHQASSAPPSNNINGSLVSSKNRVATFNVGNDTKRNMMINGRREVLDERQQNSAKLSEVVDIYESSRYDALLLKEDLNNTDWLHSADDKCDQDSIFGNGFEHLPEPFGLI